MTTKKYNGKYSIICILWLFPLRNYNVRNKDTVIIKLKIEMEIVLIRIKRIFMIFCNIMSERFCFMPLGLVRLRTFRLSTWVS